jgi:hypothetical protein
MGLAKRSGNWRLLAMQSSLDDHGGNTKQTEPISHILVVSNGRELTDNEKGVAAFVLGRHFGDQLTDQTRIEYCMVASWEGELISEGPMVNRQALLQAQIEFRARFSELRGRIKDIECLDLEECEAAALFVTEDLAPPAREAAIQPVSASAVTTARMEPRTMVVRPAGRDPGWGGSLLTGFVCAIMPPVLLIVLGVGLAGMDARDAERRENAMICMRSAAIGVGVWVVVGTVVAIIMLMNRGRTN